MQPRPEQTADVRGEERGWRLNLMPGCDWKSGLMAARWLSIRIELTGVRGTAVRPSPGRLFAASPDHTFADLAAAVNIAFARWDPHHLYEFVLPDGTCAGDPSGDWGMRADELANAHQLHLDRVLPGQEFRYEFDLAARWTHRCSIDSDPIDPADYFPALPDRPQPYWGWGAIPDQYASPPVGAPDLPCAGVRGRRERGPRP